MMYTKEEKESLKLSILNNVTSAENLAQYIYHLVSESLPITKISLQETTSSTVIYENSN